MTFKIPQKDEMLTGCCDAGPASYHSNGSGLVLDGSGKIYKSALIAVSTGIQNAQVGLHCVYDVHRIDAFTDLSVVVVEGIGLHVEDILVSLVLSIIMDI